MQIVHCDEGSTPTSSVATPAENSDCVRSQGENSGCVRVLPLKASFCGAPVQEGDMLVLRTLQSTAQRCRVVKAGLLVERPPDRTAGAGTPVRAVKLTPDISVDWLTVVDMDGAFRAVIVQHPKTSNQWVLSKQALRHILRHSGNASFIDRGVPHLYSECDPDAVCRGRPLPAADPVPTSPSPTEEDDTAPPTEDDAAPPTEDDAAPPTEDMDGCEYGHRAKRRRLPEGMIKVVLVGTVADIRRVLKNIVM